MKRGFSTKLKTLNWTNIISGVFLSIVLRIFIMPLVGGMFGSLLGSSSWSMSAFSIGLTIAIGSLAAFFGAAYAAHRAKTQIGLHGILVGLFSCVQFIFIIMYYGYRSILPLLGYRSPIIQFGPLVYLSVIFLLANVLMGYLGAKSSKFFT